MTTLAVAPGVRLFVLGDEGVLFSESRQELYTLNASATLLWCLLEAGASLDALVDGYARTFGLTNAEAEIHVHPQLRRWFGLGHLSGLDLPGRGRMPLAEALACLLTNPTLRSRFRESSDGVCGALGVADDERESFLALDPEALEREAATIVEHRRQERYGVAPAAASLAYAELFEAAARASSSPDAVERRYRFLGTTFQITMPPAFDRLLQPVLVHLEIGAAPIDVAPIDAAPIDVALSLRESADGYVVFEGLEPVTWHETTGGMVPSIKLLLRKRAVERRRYFMEIHAGVVRLDGGVVLLPGSAGRGKTTLTAALAQSAGIYFSDEIALLDEGSLDVRPVPLAMTIKPGSVEPLRELYPEIGSLHEHLREDHQPVRYLPPRPDRCAVDEAPAPARWVVFPRYEAGVETVATELSAAQGLKRLLDESLVLPALLDRRAVERLVEWTRQLTFYELQLSSLDAGVRAVCDLAARD